MGRDSVARQSPAGSRSGTVFLVLLQPLQHLPVVPLGLDLLEDVGDVAVLADDERRAGGAPVLAAVHVLLLPGANGTSSVPNALMSPPLRASCAPARVGR